MTTTSVPAAAAAWHRLGADHTDADAVDADASPEGTETRPIVVLDTSVLLSDPESIFAFGDAEVVLPLRVIEELDDKKARLDDIGRAARSVGRMLEQLRLSTPDGDLRHPVPLTPGGRLRIVINGVRVEAITKLGLDPDKSDNRILAAALGLAEDGTHVRLISADVNLRLKAAALGLEAEEYRHTRRGIGESHAGWHQLAVSRGLVDALYGATDRVVAIDDVPDIDAVVIEPLDINEFAILQGPGRESALTRRVAAGLRLVRRDRHPWDLHARSPEQHFALDLLMDPSVPVVGLSGRAGTGKSILAMAAGLEQTFEPTSQVYDRMMILRPVIAVGRQEVGFLPGDLEEKLAPWFGAIVDAMVALGDHLSYASAREMLDSWVTQGKLTMEAVTFLRGRSLQNTYIWVDEAQNLEPLTLKTILTRLGEGSKVVLVGDVTQIDNPYTSSHSNAISVLTDRFEGQELFGHLELFQGERSAVADLAAELL